MEYIDRKDTHLKFHRLMQFLGWPLLIIANGAMIATCISSIFKFTLPWPIDFLTQTQQFVTTLSKGSITPLLTSVILIILALIFLVLEFYTWMGSFKWRKYSYRSWLITLFFGFLVAAALAAGAEFFLIRGDNLGLILGAQVTSAVLKARIILGLRIMLIMALLIVAFFIYLNVLYYFKRRKLYRSEDWYEEDENMPEYGKPEVTSSIQPLPETPKPAAPASSQPELVMPESKPQTPPEEIKLEMPDPVVPDRSAPANFIEADKE